MKKLLLGIVISNQTSYGCVSCDVYFRNDISRTQTPTVEYSSISYDKCAYKWYYETFTKNIFENTLDGESRQAFEEDFMKITQSKVGRTLLHRIFCEIRRRKSDDKNAKLRIISDDMGFVQEDKNGYATLRYSTKKINACTIDLSKKHWYSRHLKLSPDIEDNRHIHLFHELCHWFHFLRNPERKHKETNFHGNILDYPLGRYYFKGAKPKWMGKSGNITHETCLWVHDYGVGIEEVRTIFGAPNDQSYREGDDLCENLYRYDVGAPLWYGHVAYDSYHIQLFKYRADIDVIDRAITICKQNYKRYK